MIVTWLKEPKKVRTRAFLAADGEVRYFRVVHDLDYWDDIQPLTCVAFQRDGDDAVYVSQHWRHNTPEALARKDAVPVIQFRTLDAAVMAMRLVGSLEHD